MDNYKLLLVEENYNIFLDGIDLLKASIINYKAKLNFYDFIEMKLAVDEFYGCKSIITTEYNGKYTEKKKQLYVLEEQFEKIKKIIFEFAVATSFCDLDSEKCINFEYYWEAVEYINYLRKNNKMVYIDQIAKTHVMTAETTIDSDIIDEKYNDTFSIVKKYDF